MESRWILFPGQTLSNTKISNRHHALHITQENWGKITRHLDRHKIKQEELDKEEAWKRYLRDGSRKMMENWENSLENIRKKKEEEKLKRIAQKKDDRMQRYFEIRKEQEQMRNEYIEKVQKHLFQSTGFAKELTSAFIESEMLYEREKQMEFDEFLKKHENEEEAKYAEKVKENARKEAEEKKEQQRKTIEKDREYGAYLKSVIQSNKEMNEKRREEKIQKETQDNIMAMEETECLKKAEEKEKLKQKQEMFIEKKKAEKALAERKRQTQKEQKEMSDVIEIYQETKHRIDCMKKERQKELQAAMVARRAAVADLVSAKQKAKDDEEERVRKNAIAEREKAEADRVLEKLEFSRKMKQDRLDDRKQCIERQKIQKQKEIKVKKWEMINRYKTDEVMKEYDENKKREHWNKVLEYRKELLEQIKEDKEESQRIEELEKAICRANMNTENADRKFFEYAKEVLEQAKRRGRPTYPIEKVILEYKKTNLRSDVEKKIFDMETKSNCEPKIKKLVKKRQCRCKN